MKNLLVLIILALVASLMFSINALAGVDITFWHFPTIQPKEEGQEVGWYEDKVIAEFEALYPNIKVNHQVIPWQDGAAKFNIAIASGAAPDVVWTDEQQLLDWANRGLLLDFEDLLTKEEKADYDEFTFKKCIMNEKVVILPWYRGAACMAVNYDIAVEAGAVDLLPQNPLRTWTIEEFETYLRAIKPYCDEKGYIVACVPAIGAEHHTWMLMMQWGAEVFSKDLSKCTLNSPEGVKAMEWFLHLRDEGLQPPHPENEPGDTELYYAYMDGKVGMYFCAGSNLAYPSVTGLNSYLTTKPGPLPEPRTWVSMCGVVAFDNGNAEKAKASKLFAKFFADKQEELFELGLFPVKKSVKFEWDNHNMQYLNDVTDYGYDFPTASPHYREARKLFSAELQAAYAGIKTVQEALDDFCKSVNVLTK